MNDCWQDNEILNEHPKKTTSQKNAKISNLNPLSFGILNEKGGPSSQNWPHGPLFSWAYPLKAENSWALNISTGNTRTEHAERNH